MKFLKLMLVIFASALFSVATQAANKDWIVLFKASELNASLAASRNVNHNQMEQALRKANHTSVQRLSHRLVTLRGGAFVKKDLWLIRGVAIEADTAAIAVLQKDPTVAAILPDTHRNWITDPAKKIRRPLKSDLDKETPWGIKAIKIPELRKTYGKAFLGQGVRVGILDTGIQSRHPEFETVKGPIVFNDFVNKMSLPYDDHGHGTHVAGTIAGLEVGIAPQVSLVIGKIFDGGGGAADSTILEGMQWIFNPDGNPATSDFPQVVNNSWGYDLESGFQDIRKQEHFRRALGVWIAGGIVPVFAAGNSSSAPNGAPAGLPESIAVGSFNKAGAVSDFSSRGPNLWTDGTSNFRVFKPDCSAPGEAILSASPDNKYVTMSGTSMATPHVTGSIALLLQILPKLHPFDALQMLTDSSVKKGDPGYGIGMLDTLNLVKTAVESRQKRNAVKY